MAELASQHQLIDHICGVIDEHLLASKPPYAPVRYSDETRRTFLYAWTLAAQQHQNQVTEDHILAALLADNLTNREVIAKIAKSDPLSLFIGSLARVSRFEPVVQPEAMDALLPSEHLVSWIGEAGRFASSRDSNPRIEPTDFVGLSQWSGSNASVRTALSRRLILARQSGDARTQVAKTWRASDSANQTASRLKSSTQDALKSIKENLRILSNEVADGRRPINSQLAQLAEQIGQTGGAIAALEGGIVGAFSSHVADIKQLIEQTQRKPLELDKPQLEELTRQIAAFRSPMPDTPSAGRLAMAVAGVVMLGVASGLALNHFAPAITAVAQPAHQASPVK